MKSEEQWQWSLGFKMFVYIRHVSHDLLPVRPLNGDHLRKVEAVWDPNRLGRLKCNGKVSPFLTGLESIVRNFVGHVGVEK